VVEHSPHLLTIEGSSTSRGEPIGKILKKAFVSEILLMVSCAVP
jgi:hypothetical protein